MTHPLPYRPERGPLCLSGSRIMVVDDELLVAMLIEETLIEHGCEVVGPFTTLETALSAAGDASIQAAVLDVNLRGQRVYPVAEMLEARGIPFMLMSGYGRDGIPAEHPGWIAQSKPFLPGDLIRTLAGLLRRPGTG